MALAKLVITPLDAQGIPQLLKVIVVQFNPESVSVTKDVDWPGGAQPDAQGEPTGAPVRKLNAPPLQFSGGRNRRLTLNLFYDVTEPVAGVPVPDVRLLTNRIAALARIDRLLGRPPIVRLIWGLAPLGSDFPFTGVLTQLTQNFTLFSALGNPLRADLSLSFTEFLQPELDLRETDPELTTRALRRGDTLSSIAAAVYQDPRQWRRIADANDLDDPRRLEVGRTLSIPDPS